MENVGKVGGHKVLEAVSEQEIMRMVGIGQGCVCVCVCVHVCVHMRMYVCVCMWSSQHLPSSENNQTSILE